MVVFRPGRPFWSAFTAFSSSMISLWGVDSIDITLLRVQVSFLGALIVSTFVAAAVYGQAKVAMLTPRSNPGGQA